MSVSDALHLVRLIETSPRWSTSFKQISSIPGSERWRGLCPFHRESTASFDVFVGAGDHARFYCQGCGRKGDAVDWYEKVHRMSRVEAFRAAGRPVAHYRPDPRAAAEKKARDRAAQRRKFVLKCWYDYAPDSCCPDWLIDTGDSK